MKKRGLSFLLAICMVLTLFPMASMAEEDVLESSDIYADVSFADAKAYFTGSGTAQDPFQIWTADDLYYINYLEYWRDTTDSPEVYYYQQMGDIDLSDAARFDKKTGYITANFGGVYDGGGFSVSGMTKPLFYFTKGTYIGDGDGAVFASYVSGDSHDKVFSAIVRDLTIQEPAIEQTVAADVIEQLGAVAAYAINTAFYNITVSGGYVNGVSGAASIAGRAGSVVLDGCVSDATIYSSMHRASGMVANIRIIDEKKGATTTSLVTGCTYSGSISGQMDGRRGAAGIVGGAYCDGETTLTQKLPLYLIGNTFSGGSISLDLTGDSAMGGILGVVLGEVDLVVRDNTVSDVTMDAKTNDFALDTGGIIGRIDGYSNEGVSSVIEGNTVENTDFPVTDVETKVFAGQTAGTYLGTLDGSDFTISAEGDNTGDYGSLYRIWVTGDIGDLTDLPISGSGLTMYVSETGKVGNVTTRGNASVYVYNEGDIGNITNTSNVYVYSNTGTIGDITSEAGGIYVGSNNKSAATAEEFIGNEGGTIGNLSAAQSISIYRNAGTIGDVTSETGGLTVGNNNDAEVYQYNTNSGTIGGITTKTNVTIYGNTETGRIAVGKAIVSGSSVTLYGNAGQIGDVSGTSISVGNSNRAEDDGKGAMGNTGTIGNLTSTGGISVNRNTETGVIGDVTAASGVTIGTNNASYNGYTSNFGRIGNVTSETAAVNIYGSGAAGSIGDVTAETTVTIGATTALNKNDIGNITAKSTVSIYSEEAEIGDILRDGPLAANVNIGSAAAPNKANIGNITNPAATVTGYTLGTVGTVTAKTNSLLLASAAEAGDVITTSGTFTITADADGNITVSSLAGQTFAPNSKLMLTAASNITFDGDNPVALSSVQGSGAMKFYDPDGLAQIGSITSSSSINLGDNTNLFAGTVTGDISGTTVYLGSSSSAPTWYFPGTVLGNISASSGCYIYNIGTVGTQGSTTITNTGSNLSMTNGISNDADHAGTIYSDAISDGNATTVSLSNNTGSLFAGSIANRTGGGVTVTNNGLPMAGDISNDGTALLSLGGSQTDNSLQYTGTVSTLGDISIGGNIGPNAVDSAIAISIADGATITAGNYSFYLKALSTDALSNLTVSTIATTTGKNTVDLTALTGDGLTVTNAAGAGTEVKLPASAAEGAVGTLVTVSGNKVTNGTEVANVDAYYAGGTLIVEDGMTVSEGKTLTLTSSSVSLYNFGTIGNIKHTGGGTLTIYNIGENAAVGTIQSNGSVTVHMNEGAIGDITATTAVTVGLGNKAADAAADANATVGKAYAFGNDGTIGNLTANSGAVTIYRNSAGSVIGAVTAGTSVAVGQNSADYLTYNNNAGQIGDITAAAAVSVYGLGADGSVEDIQAGGNINIGASTAVNGGYAHNQNDIGAVTATGTGTVTVYNGAAEIDSVSSETGSISLHANAANGSIGDVHSADGAITVGGRDKTAANAAAVIGNEGTIGDITSDINAVTVYRNTNAVGNVTAGTSATIGQSSSNTDVTAYTTNTGSVGSVTAGTAVSLYGAAGGRVAMQENEKVSAGTSVTIGSSTLPNENTIGPVEAGTSIVIYGGENGKIDDITAGTSVSIGGTAALNEADIASVYAETTMTVYTGETEIGAMTANSSLYVNANAGTITSLESETAGINIGSSSKTADNAGLATGNSGTIGNTVAATSITVYRNTETGILGDLTAGTSVVIGQNTADTAISSYNTNSGTIGSVASGTSYVYIYGNTATGRIAADSGKSVTTGTTLTVGSSANGQKNEGVIGPVTVATTATINNAGTIGPVVINGKSTSNLYVYDGAALANIQMGAGLLNVYDMTTSGSQTVNVLASGGKVEVIANEETGETNTQVHITATDGLTDGQYLVVRGKLATVVHNGAGDVIMESADTTIATVVENATGEVLTYGEAGAVIRPEDGTDAALSLAQVGPGSVEVRLVSANGTALTADTLTIDSITGGSMEETAISIAGGGLSELLGTLSLDTTTAGEVAVAVSASYAGATVTGSMTAVVPALVARVDTVLLTSQSDFEAATEQYGWADTVTAPETYPVLAVMPVTDEAFADAAVSVQVNETAVADGVAFVPVDMADKVAGSVLTASVAASLAGFPNYSGEAIYTLTDLDIAKLDTENAYFYVTYQYMDATTADKVLPVVQGESILLEEPATRAGYTFLSWSDGTSAYTANTEFTPTGDVSLVAQWASSASGQTYTLTLDVSGNGSVVRVEDDQEFPISSGTKFTAGTVLTLKANYTGNTRFRQWNVDGETISDNPVVITMDADKDVTARFYRRNTQISSPGGSGGSGGSGSISLSGYAISVGSAEHGSVSLSETRAQQGTVVTVTVEPDEGYQLGSLVVTDADNNELELTETEDGSYTFTMPASRVTVTAAFQEMTDGSPLPFTDVNTEDWFYQAVQYVYDNGLMNGIASDTFGPNITTTRGMIVTILYRLEGEPPVSGNPFADVEDAAYYAHAISWAAENGIVEGYGNGLFGPDDHITREQLAAILYRYADFKGIDISAGEGVDLTAYTDFGEISDYAQSALRWMVGSGLCEGKGDGVLDPQGYATRAEAAAVLQRYLEN